MGWLLVLLGILGGVLLLSRRAEAAVVQDPLKDAGELEPTPAPPVLRPSSGDLEAKIHAFAAAVAKAEGFYVPGSLAARNHNPGDLTEAGQLRVFANDLQGWQALRDQVRRMFTNNSAFYSLDMTIREVADTYTGGDNPDLWASIVSQELGLDADSTLEEFVGS